MIIVEVPLSNAPDQPALIDARDAKRVLAHRWFIRRDENTNYAYANIWIDGVRRRVQLHRFVLDLKAGDPWVDHIDHNGLNNTRANLRLVTASQNHMNRRTGYGTSRFKGVFAVGEGRWQAQFKRQKLGVYSVEEEAARAYDYAAWHADRAHCHLNFPLKRGQQPRKPIPNAPTGRSKHSPGQYLEVISTENGIKRRWVPWTTATPPVPTTPIALGEPMPEPTFADIASKAREVLHSLYELEALTERLADDEAHLAWIESMHPNKGERRAWFDLLAGHRHFRVAENYVRSAAHQAVSA